MATRDTETPPLHRDRQVVAAVIGALVGAIATAAATYAFVSGSGNSDAPQQRPTPIIASDPSPPSTAAPSASAPLSPAATPAPVLLALEERQTGSTREAEVGDAKVNGRTHADSVQIVKTCFVGSEDYVDDVDYDLGRRFTKFTAYAGMRDDSLKDFPARMSVYGDGRRLKVVDVVLGKGAPLSLDVTGVLRLTLRVEWQRNECHGVEHLATAVWGTPTVS